VIVAAIDIRGATLTSEPDHTVLLRLCPRDPSASDAEDAAIGLGWPARRAAVAIDKGLRSGIFRPD
jgi:hypothetical protein